MEGSLGLGREVSVFRSGKVSAFGSRVGKSPCLSRVGGGKSPCLSRGREVYVSGSGEGSLRIWSEEVSVTAGSVGGGKSTCLAQE